MSRKHALLGTAVFLTTMLALFWSRPSSFERAYGPVIHEETSDFSKIRIRERDGVRSLNFVDDAGIEQRQSAINLKKPHELELAYTRALFVSLLFRDPQARVLIVGLGGGGMVRFLNHSLPDTHVEAVEIDPAVVRIAEQYFGVTSGSKTTIHTRDAFAFLKEAQGPYDAIYMDAFLKPRADSGLAEVTQRLKTTEFLLDIQSRLKPEGLVAFNLIAADSSTPEDIESIQSVFPSVYIFDVPGSGNLVVIGSLEATRLSKSELIERAAMQDRKLGIGLNLRDLAEGLWEEA